MKQEVIAPIYCKKILLKKYSKDLKEKLISLGFKVDDRKTNPNCMIITEDHVWCGVYTPAVASNTRKNCEDCDVDENKFLELANNFLTNK